MSVWTAVLPSAELAEGTSRGLQAGLQAVCVVRVDGELFAFDDACPHRGTPLSQGRLKGSTLTCAAHTWEWNVRTGELLRLRAPDCLAMRGVREQDGMIEVQVQ